MKARFFALAALVLGLASCQQEFNGAAPVGGEVDFQLSVGAGEISATRADIDGDTQEGYDSAYGAIDYFNEADWAAYDLRYSLEVYDVADDYTNAVPVKDRMVQIVDKYEPVTFDLRLVPNRDYHFVVFADFVLQGASSKANTEVQSELGLRHNIGDNLGQITIKSDAINDEIADAYFATKDIRIENSAAKDIVLKRPYGKVRVIATDLDELNLNVTPGKVMVEYDKFHPLTFNAVTGEVDGEYNPCTYECYYDETIYKEKGGLKNHFYNIGYDEMTTTNANGVERHKYMTLFTDYILAENEGQTAYHFTMTVWDQNDGVIKETHFNTDIPVARNMLTTVVGNVLTTATEINVSIDDNFATKYTLTMWDGKSVKPVVENNNVYEIYEAAELAWFAQQVNEGNKFSGKTVKLCKDIHLNGEAWTPIGATGKFEGTFDGQNHVIEGLFVNMTDKTPAGLFANAKYVKDLKVCHAEVYGHYKSAVIVGDGLCSRIDNCHVENATVVVTPFNKDDANHVGGIVGYLSAENEAWVKDCSVKNAEIRGYRDVAAIAGTANQAAVVTGNKVENVTVIADQTAEYKEVKVANVDAIAGRVHAKATVSGNTVGENVEVYVLVNTGANLEYQANNSPANRDIKIVLVGEVEGNAVIKQREGVNVIVAGAEGNSYNSFITINGDARYDGEETLKFEGINFKSNEGMDFIYAPTKYENKYNYSHNITVDGCTFSSEAFNEKIVGIKLQTTYNAVIKNCKAENIHSLAQISSTDNEIVIEKVEVVNCKNGLGLGNIAKAVINDANISATGYGIRLDGEKSRAVAATIENSTIEAYIPVNIRRMNDAACNVDVEFLGTDNVLVGNIYEIAFCSNEYEQGVDPQNPVGSFRLQNAEEFRAFYGTVTSFSAFDAAVNSNSDTVVAEGNISMPGMGVEVERDVVLDFDGFEYNAGSDASSRWYALEIYGDHDVVVKNANFTRAGIYANGADVVFENGTINHKPERSSRYIFCAQSGSTITIKDGTFNNDRQNNAYFWADAATIVVEGGNFGGVASKNKVVLTNNGQVIIKGGTFNFDPTAYVAPGSVVEKVDSNWVVSAIDESANIADVIKNAAAGQTIVCPEGTVIAGSTNLNIKGATVVGATFSNPSGTAVGSTINGTFKNCTFTGSNALRYCYAGETVVFENCVFSGNTYGVHFDGGANDVIFRNCTISGFNALGAALTMVTFEGCTFVGNGKSGYNGANLWGSATLKNCEFTFNGTTQNEWIDCIKVDGQYSFENCTVNGVAYTAENADDYADTIFSRNDVTVKINDVDCAL